MTSSSDIDMARAAILAELKRRRHAGDKTVFPAPPDSLHRWYQPQANYFCGVGRMDCPICKSGELQYARNSYNGHVQARCSSGNCVCWIE